MANERSTDLILRGLVDQAVGPISQVTQRVRDLTAVLEAQAKAAKDGETNANNYAKSLQAVEKISGDLLRQRALLNSFVAQQERSDKAQAALDEKIAKRDALAAESPLGARTATETKELDRLDKSIAGSTERMARMNATMAKSVDQLTQMGVLTNALVTSEQRLEAVAKAHEVISANQAVAIDALRAEKEAVGDKLVEVLRVAGVEKQTRDQQARDTQKFLADQEKERQSIIETAETVRAAGRAAQAKVDEGARRSRRQEDIEAAVKDDEAAIAAAEHLVAVERAGAVATEAFWKAQREQAEKARLATEAFAESIRKAIGQAQAAQAHGTAQAFALGAPKGTPAPTLAGAVSGALGPAPGAGISPSNLADLQLAVNRLDYALRFGTTALKSYTQGLKDLDTISREALRQSKIVDNFQAQEKAARSAVQALHAARAQIDALEQHLQSGGAKTPEEVAEVTSRIADARKRIGSVDGGGLAAAAQREIVALREEELELEKIGITAAQAAGAHTRLTQVAITTSKARQEIYAKEKAELGADVDAILAKTATLSTAAPVARPGVAAQVAAVGGDPRGAATIKDTAAAVDKLEGSMSRGKLTAQSFNMRMDEIYAVQRQLAHDASLVDTFAAADAAMAKTAHEFITADTALVKLAADVKAGTRTLAELEQAAARLVVLETAAQKAGAAQKAAGAALRERGIDTANLTAATNKLVESSTRLAAVQNQTQQSGGKILGLSPYQFQNLQFQVNDVVTQLSLGQGVLRTFESQAGQIFQIFNLSSTAMARMLYIGGPLAVTIGLVVASLLRLKETVDIQRDFSKQLALSVDGANYQAKVLTETVRAMEAYGISVGDARAASKEFLRDGLNPETMLRFAKAAHDLADTMGIEFKDALKQISVVSNGSLADILKLNEGLNFLHESEARSIRDSFESGNAADGRRVAFEALTRQVEETKKKGIDPFTEAGRELSATWRLFLDTIGNETLYKIAATELRGLVVLMRGVGAVAKEIAADFRYIFGGQTSDAANAKVKDLGDKLGRVEATLKALRESGTLPESDPTMQRLIADAKKLQDELTKALEIRGKLTAPSPVTEVPGGVPGNDAERSVSAVALSFLGKNQNQVGASPGFENLNSADLVNKWCAAFANAALKQVGLSGSGSNVATSFETWGKAVATGAIQAGDILVQSKGRGIGEPGGHVGFATGNFKTASDGTLLVEMVSGNYGGRVDKDYLRADTLDARRAGTAATGSDFRQSAKETEAAAIRQDGILRGLIKENIEQVNPLLRGNARILSDQARVNEFAKGEQSKVNDQLKLLPGEQIPKAIQDEINKKIDTYAKNLEDLRLKEIQDASREFNDIVKAAADAVDRSNKTSPEAQRRVVDRGFESQMDAIRVKIRDGAEDSVRSTLQAALANVEKARDQAREKATIDTDRAIVDTITKTRDERVQAVANDLHTGAISLTDAFDKIALIVKTFKPKIEEAVGRSNADLARQPQTAAIQEQFAKNAKINANDPAAFETIDKAAIQQVNDLVRARNELIAVQNHLYDVGKISRREQEDATKKIYDETTPKIEKQTSAVRDYIEAQHAAKLISDSVYEKMIADLDKAATSTTYLTREQKLLAQGIESSLSNRGLQLFDALGTAIGGVIAKTTTVREGFAAAGLAFAQFTAGVLQDVAKIIIKEQLLVLVRSGLKAVGLFAGGATDASITHEGGIIGSGGTSRSADIRMWAGAPRYHSGGMIGLAPDEVPIIAKQGEEMLKSTDPRHRKNYQAHGADITAPQSIKNVLLFDPSEVAGAMASSAGDKVIFSSIKRNAPALRALLR